MKRPRATPVRLCSTSSRAGQRRSRREAWTGIGAVGWFVASTVGWSRNGWDGVIWGDGWDCHHKCFPRAGLHSAKTIVAVSAPGPVLNAYLAFIIYLVAILGFVALTLWLNSVVGPKPAPHGAFEDLTTCKDEFVCMRRVADRA